MPPGLNDMRWPMKGDPEPESVRGETMKSVFVCKVILPVILLVFVFMHLGCSLSQPGETVAEGKRRHQRVARINQQLLMADIDTVFMLDEPSKLTDKRIP